MLNTSLCDISIINKRIPKNLYRQLMDELIFRMLPAIEIFIPHWRIKKLSIKRKDELVSWIQYRFLNNLGEPGIPVDKPEWLQKLIDASNKT